MRQSRSVRLVILGALVATVAAVACQRALGWRLGAAPPKVEGAYATEEEWIVGEIVRDIAEMSAHSGGRAVNLSIAPSAEAGRYRISIDGVPSAVDLDLRRELWNPAAFAAVARAVMNGQSPAGLSVLALPLAHHRTLVDLTPASLISVSSSISHALAANMRDVRAHESAALTLGAFALRESAGPSADTRWAMNRLTAHLAMATALGSATDPGMDGRLAEVMLLTLANRQTRALAMLGRLTTTGPDAWIRALRLRITQDWRAIPGPAGLTRLEKLEYFRARRATVASTKSSLELERLGEQSNVDWMRIVESFSTGMEGSWSGTDAVDWEVDEYEDVYQRVHGRPIDRNVADALNAKARRCIGANGPEVLPWGAWAEFAQRHLAMSIRRTDSIYHHRFRSDAADRDMQRLRSEFGTLWIFPAATIQLSRKPRTSEWDIQDLDAAIARTIAVPERVPSSIWSLLESAATFRPAERGLPPPRTWFIRPAPRAMHDAASRVKNEGDFGNLSEITAMMRDAPYDFLLGSVYLTAKYGEKPPYEEILRVFGPRKDYDLRVLRWALQRSDAAAARMGLLSRSCEVSASECLALAAEYVRQDRDDEAAASYERAFTDPLVDGMTLSNASDWLVTYYYRHRRIGPALQLAERSARGGSLQGVVTLAYLYERLKRWREAERLYREASDRYGKPAELVGFYKRVINVHKRVEFEPALNRELARGWDEK